MSSPIAPEQEKAPDPYPRMIIVCIVISAVLLVVVTGVLVFDFARRSSNEQRVQPSSPNFFAQPDTPPMPAEASPSE